MDRFRVRPGAPIPFFKWRRFRERCRFFRTCREITHRRALRLRPLGDPANDSSAKIVEDNLAIRVSGLYRHPVKSLGGEMLLALDITAHGPVGDRYWAVLDGENGRIRNAKRWPQLLLLTAVFVEPPQPDAYDDDVTHVEITAPDGSRCRSDHAGCDAWLSEKLGRAARLAARRPAYCREHYRLGGPRTADEIASDIDLQPDEPFPDYHLEEGDFLAQ